MQEKPFSKSRGNIRKANRPVKVKPVIQCDIPTVIIRTEVKDGVQYHYKQLKSTSEPVPCTLEDIKKMEEMGYHLLWNPERAA